MPSELKTCLSRCTLKLKQSLPPQKIPLIPVYAQARRHHHNPNPAYLAVHSNENKSYRHKKPCLSRCTLKLKQSLVPQKTLLVPMYTQTRPKSAATRNLACPDVHSNSNKLYRHKKPCLSRCTLKRKESPPPQKTLLVPLYAQTKRKPTATKNLAYLAVHSNSNKAHRHKKPCLSRCTLKLKQSLPPQEILLLSVYAQTQTKPTATIATKNLACPAVRSNSNKLYCHKKLVCLAVRSNKLHRHNKPCLSRCTLKLKQTPPA